MNKPHNMQRLLYMHQMLFEMARGTFTFRIPLSEYDDELESLVVLINMVAEELKDYIIYEKKDALNNRIPIFMILDVNLTIVNSSPALADVLDIQSSLIGKPINDLLVSESFTSIQQFQSAVQNLKQDWAERSLQFTTDTGLVREIQCTLATLNGENIMLSFESLKCQSSFTSTEHSSDTFQRHSVLRRSDARLIKKVYDYILANLDEPLPTLRQLAHMFATNEFKLKDGFRHMLKTSIYQFYTDERLKRAKLMIEQTETSLKNIAHLCGYNSYPNFSKAYKKKFGVTPRDTERS